MLRSEPGAGAPERRRVRQLPGRQSDWVQCVYCDFWLMMPWLTNPTGRPLWRTK